MQQVKVTPSSSSFYLNVVPEPKFQILSDLPSSFIQHVSKSHFTFLIFSGFTALDRALEAGHSSMESVIKITSAAKQPVLKPTLASTVTKKAVVKSPLKSSPAARSVAANRVASVPKIERPSRVAANKRK